MSTSKEDIQARLNLRKKYSKLSKVNRCLEYSRVRKN
jgi:hypothetical protein